MLTKILETTEPQTTLARPMTISGVDLIQQTPAQATFKPAPSNQGVTFVIRGRPLHLHPSNVIWDENCRKESITDGTVTATGIAHIGAALKALKIDNITVELLGDTMPAADSSARLCSESLAKAKTTNLAAKRNRLCIVSHGKVSGINESFVEFMPADRLIVEVVHDLPPPLGLQCAHYDENKNNFTEDFCWARNFIDYPSDFDVRHSLSLHNIQPKKCPFIAISENQIINRLHSPDEPGRHLLLDCLGALAYLGDMMHGRLIFFRPNRHLIKKLICTLGPKTKPPRTSRGG